MIGGTGKKGPAAAGGNKPPPSTAAAAVTADDKVSTAGGVSKGDEKKDETKGKLSYKCRILNKCVLPSLIENIKHDINWNYVSFNFLTVV